MTFILCGHLGVGKTTVGRELAHKKQYPFIDTDELLKEKLNCPANERLSKAHKELGENAFRDLERDTILTISPSSPSVITIGGGSFYCRPELLPHLHTIGHIIYLHESIPTTRSRFLSQKNLPYWVKQMLADNSFDTWLHDRDTCYNRASDHSITVTDLSIADIVQQCIAYGETHGF